MAPAVPDCTAPPSVARRAARPLPAGSCDTHLHVFGDPARYPLDPRRSYTPHVAPLAQYREVMAACGIERAVLVQPSVYGTDNRCLLDTLRATAAAGDGGWRGVVVPAADASDAELEAMHALGVRGIRLNLVNPQVLAADDALALCRRMAHRGWHLQLHLELDAAGEASLRALAERVDVLLVIDHFGRPPPGRIPAVLLELLQSGRAWVKLSAIYRLSARADAADRLPLVQALLEAGPERLLWGSDWPHTEQAEATPHVADLVALLHAWLPDPARLGLVCALNPARLYGF